MSGGLALSWVHEDRRGAVRRAMLGRLGSAHAVLVAPWLARSAWLHTLRADSSHVTRLVPQAFCVCACACACTCWCALICCAVCVLLCSQSWKDAVTWRRWLPVGSPLLHHHAI